MIKPTKIYPTRRQVDEENRREFRKLDTQIHEYISIDSITESKYTRPEDLTVALKDLQAAHKIQLRIGAQVMLLANLNVKEGLVNGTRGIVTDFVDLSNAESQIRSQAEARGVQFEEEIANLRAFSRGKKKFPRVLFEIQKSTKEVIPVYATDEDHCHPV